jgi:bifunctional DNase/RNase
MATIVEALDGRVDSAEVSELRDGSFLAQLALTGPSGELRLDSRPSDAIALAMRWNAPVYVSDAVLDQAGTMPREELDVDDEVDKFRDFLDQIDPSDFAVDEPEVGPEQA